MLLFVTFIICLQTFHRADGLDNEAFIIKMKNALKVTNETIDSIYSEWKVAEYPLFLKSCFMHKSSWEIMKFKLMGRIIAAFESKESKPFVVSFLGRQYIQVLINSSILMLSIFFQVLLQLVTTIFLICPPLLLLAI